MEEVGMAISVHRKSKHTRHRWQFRCGCKLKVTTLILGDCLVKASPEILVQANEEGWHARQEQSLKEHVTSFLCTITVKDKLIGFDGKEDGSIDALISYMRSPGLDSKSKAFGFWECIGPRVLNQIQGQSCRK